MRSSVFYSIIIGLLSGIIIGMMITPDNIISYWLIILIVAGLITRWLGKIITIHFPIRIFLILLLCFAIGFWHTNQFHRYHSFTEFNSYNNQTISVTGIITESPGFKPGIQTIRIHPNLINGETVSLTAHDIVATFSDLDTFSSGDQVIISGKYSLRSDFESDTGRIVQYRLMSYSRGISGDIKNPKLIELIKSHSSFGKFFAMIKYRFMRTLNELFVSPASGLLAGIIIGDTSNLDSGLLDIFRAVGLIHIVVLSGYNITLVANFFVRLFAPLGYHRRLSAAMIALIFFILIVGVSPTATRAGIMAFAAFAARYYVRPYVITRGILIALIIMVWISPYALLFDLSLQLSFLATFGIVYIFPFLSDRFEKLAENTFGEILLQTIAVNIVTLPIIIYQMGYFSLISFPINIAVLAFVPLLTILGFFAVFVGMIIIPFGKIIAFPVQIIINTMIALATWTADHDPFKISFPLFSVYWIFGAYVLIFWWLVRRSSKQ